MVEENPFARLFNAAPAAGTIATLAQLAPSSSSTNKIEINLVISNPKTSTYHCISYDRSREWEKKDVIVDGRPMPIPLPLEQALRYFRHATEPVLVWADLLTGDSPQDRSKQALVMKEVVENALAVTCFLGAGNELSTKAYAVLQTVANWWNQAALTFDFPNERLWREIENTLSAPYFKSTGALADIILGKQVLLRSGAASISWDNLNKASRALMFVLPGAGKEVSEAVKKSFELIRSIDISVQRRQKGDTLEMLPMVQSACRGTTTADPREFVFAVLPVVTPSNRTTALGRKPEPLPTADYTQTIDQVFIEAGKYIIGDRQDLFLWWGERPPRSKKIRSLPSWVPDWSASNPRPALTVKPENGLRKWWDTISSPKRMFVDSDRALHVQAHALDQIDYISPVFTQENFRMVCFAAWRCCNRVPGEPMMQTYEKFWRAVVLDTDQDFGERMRDRVKPSSDMWLSWQSVISAVLIIETLGCTMQELATTPALQARARADEACADLGRSTGRSAPIETLIIRNSLGRRLFQYRSGRIGMTAIEGGASPSDSEDGAGPRVPNFDDAMSSEMGRMMLDAFQAYVAERDPAVAALTSQALQGQLPGQAAPGVRCGDIVTVLVGGFQPYILRPLDVGGSELRADSKYTFVGDCHLQGAMDGECLLDPDETHGKWKRVPLVDVLIV